MNRQALDKFVRHAIGAAALLQPLVLVALLHGMAPLSVLMLATAWAAFMGWVVEVSQRIFGWGVFEARDVLITALGGPLACAGMMGVLYVL